MAVRVEKDPITSRPELVIDGWEKGAADSPEFGIADMRNINNDSIPGIAQCNYKLTSLTQAPLTVSFTSVNNLMTISGGTFTIDGPIAVYFTSLSGSPGVSAGSASTNVYWIVRQSSTTALVYGTFDQTNSVGSLVTLGTGAGTLNTINASKYTGYTIDPRTSIVYLLDNSGQVWCIRSTGLSPVLLSGNTLTNANGNGISIYKDFLFVFRNNKVDMYGDLTAGSYTWHNAVFTLSVTSAGFNANHYAKWDFNENVLYFCNKYCVSSISQTGDATDYTTYSMNETALQLPLTELTSYLEEPSIDSGNGTLMYIGTSTSNLIYPWDKHTTGTFAPLVMPEIGTYAMLNINKIVYILAGQRGNIYYTNGSSVIHFSSVPKYSTQSPFPLFYWGGVMSLNNNFCFGTNNSISGTTGATGGVWAISLVLGPLLNSIAGAIRYKNQPSTGLYNADVLIPLNDGLNFYACSYNGTYGTIDILASGIGAIPGPSFYTYNSDVTINQGSYIETDIIPIGTAINPKNITVIEGKLDTLLKSGDKFRIVMRSNLSDNYTSVFEQSTVGSIDGNNSGSGVSLVNLKWVQFRIDLQTTSGGSFTRFRELRFR